MPGEVAYQSASESIAASAAVQAELPLDEMTRILDVAAELHARQAVVEEQLHLNVIKDDLRKRLLSAAKAAGEPLTAQQVDHAIEQYYDNLHAYSDPPPGLATTLANIYVRFGWWPPLVMSLVAAGSLVGGILWLIL